MTDPYGANLERILRDIERRLQKLEARARVVKGLDLPDIPALTVPGVRPTYPASFDSPATVTGTVQPEHYNLLRADVVTQLFTPLRELINSGDNIGLW